MLTVSGRGVESDVFDGRTGPCSSLCAHSTNLSDCHEWFYDQGFRFWSPDSSLPPFIARSLSSSITLSLKLSLFLSLSIALSHFLRYTARHPLFTAHRPTHVDFLIFLPLPSHSTSPSASSSRSLDLSVSLSLCRSFSFVALPH